MTVGEYLAAPRPAWDWRAHDCCRWMARWVVECGHPNPMDFIGAGYSTEIGALRLIRRGGGLVPLWDKGMDGAGVPRAGEPLTGDVAVLSNPTDDGIGEACGIWSGMRWVSLHKRGLMAGVGAPLAIWRV